MTLALNKYNILLRLLEGSEIDANWAAIETFINGLLAGTAGYEAGNALKLGGVAASGYGMITSGTWAPLLAFGGASAGITYIANTGRYTKIGNCVFFSVAIALSDKGSSTGVATVTLPFTSAAYSATLVSPTNTFTIPAPLYALTLAGTALTQIRYNNTGNQITATNALFANESQFGIDGFYFV